MHPGRTVPPLCQILDDKTPRMTQRYVHLSPDYMAASVGKLDGIMDRMLPANCTAAVTQ